MLIPVSGLYRTAAFFSSAGPAPSGKNVIMVISAAAVQLDILRADITAELLGLPEIEGRTGNAQQPACGQAALIVLRKLIRENLQRVVECRAAAARLK
jgi:hypothetical protein